MKDQSKQFFSSPGFSLAMRESWEDFPVTFEWCTVTFNGIFLSPAITKGLTPETGRLRGQGNVKNRSG